MANVTIRLNGSAITADSSMTILQVARANGVDIPTLCYDPRLPPYGSCLACVVEVKSAGRLLMACTTPVAEGMEIHTESPAAIQARRSALEMLLSNHYADCRGPCFLKCPANVDVQGYLAFAAAGMHREALDLIRETNPMPLSCGRVCVRYCEANCRRKDVDSPAAINFMKRYVSDLEFDRLPKPVLVQKNGKKVAVVGGGPAGLTCGYYLARKGYEVVLFDKQPKLGGMLRYGIPEYRLPEAVLDKEINYLLAHGIDARTGVRLGKDVTLDGLKKDGFGAIFLAMGSWVAKGMGVENEKHPKILPGIVFLEGVKRDGPPKLGGTVAIVGGGNTAIDAARTALRCGAEKVTILYRRTRAEMPADDIEVEDALEEGIEIQFLTAPKKAVTDGETLVGLECFRMELGEPDASGRRRPVQMKGSEFLFKADWVVSAIGQEQDLSGLENTTLGRISLTKWNSIEADPGTLATNVEGVFAGGDVMTGPAAAIDAIGAGRRAAWVIDRYLETGKIQKFQGDFYSARTALAPLDPSAFAHLEKTERGQMPKLDKAERAKNWEEVDLGVKEAQVVQETSRCLSCGCTSVFDCDLKVFAGNYDAKQEHYKGKFKKQKIDERHPFIILDGNKCILCGRCVRYCGELIGVHALGFINRGYDTVVKPSLDKPLTETDCISCGNCIEVCPTGAITFKMKLDKPGPFRTIPYRSVCSFCGVGCEIDVNHTGRDFFFVTAKPADPFTEGELCAKGRFGSYYLGSRDRIYNPSVRGRGNVGMHEAAKALADGLSAYNGDETLFLASPRVSTETAYLFASLAAQRGSRFVFAAEDLRRDTLPDASGLSGFNISTVRQDDLRTSGAIVTVGGDVFAHNPVFGFKVRRAAKDGAGWIHIGKAAAAWRRLVTHHLDCAAGAEAQTLAALCGAIVGKESFDRDAVARARNGKQFLAHGFEKASEEAEKAAALIADRSVKVVVVVNRDTGKAADVAWAADLALLTGRTCGARGGLLVVRNEANGQGFDDIVRGGGFSAAVDLARAKAALAAGRIRAVVSLGADIAALDGIDKASFTAAIDMFNSGATAKADLIVPLCPLQEEDGSVVSFDGRIIKFRKAFKPLAGFTNTEFLAEALAQAGGARHDLVSVRAAVAAALPLYGSLRADTPNVHLCDEAAGIGGVSSFSMAPVNAAKPTAYESMTTYARIWEPK